MNTLLLTVCEMTKEDECKLKFVPNTADVKVGDHVLSSGLGGIFPKGLITRLSECVVGINHRSQSTS